MNEINRDSSKIQKALSKIINWAVSVNNQKIKLYVDKLRAQNTNISNDALAKKIVKRKSFKNGLLGAATGVGGAILLPVGIPADIVYSFKIQASMACAVAYVYGHTENTTDLKTDIYIIIAGNMAKDALKTLGIEATKSVTKKTIEKYVTREIMKQINKVVSRKIITKSGEKSLTRIAKMVPLVGAPIGFVFDWSSCRLVGRNAIKYYNG